MGSLKSRLSWMVKVSNFYYYRNIPREPESPQVLIIFIYMNILPYANCTKQAL